MTPDADPRSLATDVKELAHRAKGTLILRGLLALTLGAFILSRPLESVAAFALVIALWALVDGFIMIVYAFELKPVAPHWWALLLAGIVSICFGVLALYYYPNLSLSFAVIWVAMWLFTAAAIAVFVALKERQLGVQWGWTMTFGVLAVVAGAFALAYPGVTLTVLMAFIASFGIVAGISLLVGAGRVGSFERQIDQRVQGTMRA